MSGANHELNWTFYDMTIGSAHIHAASGHADLMNPPRAAFRTAEGPSQTAEKPRDHWDHLGFLHVFFKFYHIL